ncbi:MFS transporter [Paraburkholderia sp. HD33-4]|uniref:MFS transporter n=1 Tax=Paraburkholderia sp. HD33-4 TaxID=2883242 RepID=UPI001F3820EB|nr:MFS transporter [Paraburkholderia sp. HD33-4]
MRKKATSLRTLAAGSIGNFIEIYDFAVFGFSVPIIAQHFFPGTDKTAALLSVFAVYAVAFFARPVGGVIFGYLADIVGRTKVLAWTVWLMAAGTAFIGLLPTYSSLGVAAPILLVMFRFAQGMALGGETSGAASYIIESASEAKRGRWVGASYAFGYIANACVGILFMLQDVVGKVAYTDWVWRAPFVIGGLLGIVGFWLRLGLEEPDEFKEVASETAARNPMLIAARSGTKGMVHVLLLMPVLAVSAYLLLGFMFTFLVTQVKMPHTMALLTNAAGIAAIAITLPLAGSLSDRFGRKKIVSLGAVWIALSAFPALWLASSGTVEGALIGQVVFGIGVGIYGAASMTAMLEVFPTAYRATGHAISYQFSVAVFGGTTPFIATWLVHKFNSPLAPGVYTAIVGAVGLLAIQFVPETRHLKLRTSTEDSNHSDMPDGAETAR